MIVAKNMLIPEIKVAPVQQARRLSWARLCKGLDRLDAEPTCYVVLALVRNGRDSWHIKYGKVV